MPEFSESRKKTRLRRPRVLLVGKFLAGSLEIRFFLEGLGARLHFSETLAGAVSLLRLRRFDVVLSQAQLPEGGACQLLQNLLTSTASFVLSFPVESGCLWIPAIWNGEPCWGTMTLRPAEFRAKLRELLGQHHS